MLKNDFFQQYEKAICFIDWQRICLKLEWQNAQVREILLTEFGKKNVRGLRHIFNDFQKDENDLGLEMKDSFKRYLTEFDKCRVTFDIEKDSAKTPESFEEYCHLILRSIGLFNKSDNTEFTNLNRRIYITDVRKFNIL